MSWDHIINTGSPTWHLVEKGHPSADLAASACNALPDVSDWEKISAPLGINKASSSLTRADKHGTPVIAIDWELEFEFGSRYQGGGAFIRTCWITVSSCFVGFGYDMEMAATVESPQNKGSSTAPIGLLRVHIDATVSSPYNSFERHSLVAIRGDGAMLTQ